MVAAASRPPTPTIPESASAEDEARVAQLAAAYAATAALPEIDRQLRLRALAESEHRLPVAQLRAVTLARLRAFLRLERDLPPEAMERLVGSLEAVMDALPGPLAMRRVEFVQTLVHEFPPEEQERLRRLVPGVLSPRPANGHGGQRVAVKRHPAWMFWKH